MGADSPVLPGPPDAGSDGPMPAGPNETTIDLPAVPSAAETAVCSPGPADADMDSPVPPGPADADVDSPVPPGPNEMTVELPVVRLPADMTVEFPVVRLPADMTAELPVVRLPAETPAELPVVRLPAETPAETANSRGLTALAVAAGLVVAVVGLAQTSPGHSLLREVGLSAEPATYTALAFTNPQSLPSHLSAAPAQVAVSFAVSNVSPDPHSYSWSIVLEAAGQTSRVAAGEVGVPAHGHATVTRTVTASCPGGQAVMAVRLAAPAESIDFRAACSP